MCAINNVRIYQYGSFNNLIYTFPQGHTDNGENEMACSDPANNARPKQFIKGTKYYIRYTITATGIVREWQGECEYEAGGTAGVQFGEMEMI